MDTCDKTDEKENVDDVEATKASAGSIKQIDKGVVHQICSGQVVLTLATAVKELVENSLDAGATIIEVKLRGQGAELVEVSDNGHGVVENNFAGLTIKHATSKLREFTDLVSVQTFGFRGEALSSLCALSTLSISTRHMSAQLGHVLEFDNDGIIVNKSTVARPVGTTVTVKNIFHTMPVRQKEFQRNIKKEFTKLINVMNAYGLVSCGVKIKVISVKPNNKTELIMQTQGSSNIRENIVNIFGAKIMTSLKPFAQKELSEEDLSNANIRGRVPDVNVQGFISSPVHGEGRGAPDRQFLFINSRPCDHAKLSKVINQIYHGYNRHQYPFVCLNLSTERTTVDVNITPDKRQIFLTQEKYLLELIKKSLEKMYEDAPSTMPLQSFMTNTAIKHERQTTDIKPSLNISNLKRTFSHSFKDSIVDEPRKKPKTLLGFIKVGKSGDDYAENKVIDNSVHEASDDELDGSVKKETVEDKLTFLSNKKAKNELPEEKETPDEVEKKEIPLLSSQVANSQPGLSIVFDDFVQSIKESPKKEVMFKPESEAIVIEKKINLPHTQVVDTNVGLSLIFDDFSQNPNNIEKHEQDQYESDENYSRPRAENVIDTAEKESHEEVNNDELLHNGEDMKQDDDSHELKVEKKKVDVVFDFNKLLIDKSEENVENKSDMVSRFKAQILPSENESAESELKKQLQKSDFQQMRVCGQFNLGFIIASLNKDLFIIDQHATDEKYNFETLQFNTDIKSQKMVVPQSLELTAVNESVLMDNIGVFEKNGFYFDIDESAPCTQKVKLVSLPISKNWTFGKEDIEELVFMLSELGCDGDTSSLRPSRVRAMFASRACRKSVMIGRSLTRSHMTKLIRHMGKIEQPWNCPHGRPTIRHLINTDMVRL